MINKIVYYGDKKARIANQVNEKDFRVEYGKGKQGIMDYNKITCQLTHIQEEDKDKWVLENILNHKWGKGERKNKIDLLIKWEGFDEPSWEPMEVIKEDDPVMPAKYAQETIFKDKSLWKWSKRYSNLSKTSQT